MKKIFALLIAALALAGCATNPPVPPEVRIVYRNVLVTPPDSMLTPCELQAPPNAVEYKESDWSKKEELMVNAYDGATRKTILCNVKVKALQTWKQEQIRIFESENKRTD